MLVMQDIETGTKLNVKQFFITKQIMWEYYVTDVATNDIGMALVLGNYLEMGSFSEDEMAPHIAIRINSLNASHMDEESENYIGPAPGYRWVEALAD